MDATITHLEFTDAPAVSSMPSTSLRRMIRSLGAAIVAGSDHPVFHTPGAASRLALSARGEQKKLLDAGLCSNDR